MIYTYRSFAGESDLPKLAQLLTDCEIVDQMGVRRTAEELRVQFFAPTLDPEHDVRLWENPEGVVIAYGVIEIDVATDEITGTLRWRVRPDHREHWLDDDVIRWGEARLCEVGVTKGLPARLESIARDIDRPRQFLLEWHKYDVRHELWQMDRDLHQPIDTPTLSEGFTIRAADPERDAEAWIAMYNDSFIDHWNHIDLTLEDYRHRRQTDPGYAPERDLILVAPDGTFAAFCWSFINPQEVGRVGVKQALLHQIGTRRGFRQQGLGRTLILKTLEILHDAGMDSVRLYVYMDNQNNASHLYESVGFQKAFSLVTYAKTVTDTIKAG
ncbi:MAG TPA: GNAT family N-acetyltransferase [Aggregatilineales bacterium]|nr:GNAT family N-acetyltransferase [Anaerolineales bacterium]HRE49288.1 GNAT family N-acetyltransferase [Aggregatilineales bacterium]